MLTIVWEAVSKTSTQESHTMRINDTEHSVTYRTYTVWVVLPHDDDNICCSGWKQSWRTVMETCAQAEDHGSLTWDIGKGETKSAHHGMTFASPPKFSRPQTRNSPHKCSQLLALHCRSVLCL
eukprot:6483224-Amphidinium_carterae.1